MHSAWPLFPCIPRLLIAFSPSSGVIFDLSVEKSFLFLLLLPCQLKESLPSSSLNVRQHPGQLLLDISVLLPLHLQNVEEPEKIAHSYMASFTGEGIIHDHDR